MDGKQDQTAASIASLLFRKRRTLSRILAMQFIFQSDLKDSWTLEADALESFKSLANNPFEADEKSTFSKEDFKSAWKYAQELIQGVLANRARLDNLIISAAHNWSIQRISSLDRAILRVAAFEISHHPHGVTPAIAINEAIDIAKEYGIGRSAQFVNGILDKIRADLQAEQSTVGQESPAPENDVQEEPPRNEEPSQPEAPLGGDER